MVVCSPQIQLLGSIWYQMKLELVQNADWVCLFTTPEGSGRSMKNEFLTYMVIMPLCVMVEEKQMLNMTGFEKNVSACSSANLSPVVEKITSFQKAHHALETGLSRHGKRGNLLHFDVTVTSFLQSNSLINAATMDKRLMRQMNKNISSTSITVQKWESHLFLLHSKS